LALRGGSGTTRSTLTRVSTYPVWHSYTQKSHWK